MWKLFKRGILFFHEFISAFGVRGIQIFWDLYIGRKGKTVRITLPGGARVWIRKRTSDGMVFRQIFLDREADITLLSQGTAVVDKYGEILARGRVPLIIDCGANNGMSSIFLASLFPMAIVAAIEPSGENFKLLALNVAPFDLIKPIHAGVWNTRTQLKLLNRNGSPCGFRTVECETNDPEAIAALSVPDILERFSNCDPLLIKVDVEGAEDSLFARHPSWVDKLPVLIVELHDWMLPGWETSRNFLACMARMRCDFVLKGENVFVFNWAALPKASSDKSIE